MRDEMAVIMKERSVSRWNPGSIVNAGAWVFLVGSLGPLLWLLSDYPASHKDPAARRYIFHTQIDGQREYSALGLTYEGRSGCLLLLGEIVIVLLAATLSILRADALRRTGLLMLTAWAALWTGNAILMDVVSPFWGFHLAVVLTGVFFILAIGRTLLRWQPVSSQAA